MKKLIMSLIISGLLLSAPARANIASWAITYEVTGPDGSKAVKTVGVNADYLKNGRIALTHQVQRGDSLTLDEMIMDETFQTDRFRRVDGDKTDYSVDHRGKTLFINGRFKGGPVDRKIPLDNKPFYNLPDINLSGFIFSNDRNVRFWTLRKSDLKEVMMEAKKRGETVVDLNGRKIQAVAVNYSVMHLSDKYNKAVCFYRKSDGLLVYAVRPDGSQIKLISGL